ncbi:UNC-50 [Melampsora americana]|nr:UNC-50 [Melampsora americana]
MGLLPTSVSHSTSAIPLPRSNSPATGGSYAHHAHATSSTALNSGRSKGGLEKMRKMLGKLVRPSRWPTMDFELAAWQMTYLCVAPRRVYRNVYYHKQTKNTWARDDPAILIMMIGFLSSAALLWTSLYLHSFSPITWAGVAIKMVFRDFIASGLIISTLLWATSNRFLTHSSHTHATDQHVEWQYSFDVHTNSFFPLFLNLYLAQLILAPVVTRNNWVCLWVGNSLYLVAATQYVYITYLGYNALPFLIRSELLLFPIVLFLTLYVVSLLGFNLSKHLLEAYFSGLNPS